MFEKLFKQKEKVGTHHIYMSHQRVLDPAVRKNYSPDAFFHTYRGRASDYASFKKLMEQAGHNVITSKVRFDFEGKGGPRKLDGVFVDQALTPVPKSEVV